MTTQSGDVFYYIKYARVSTDEQREGISIEFQIDRIDAWVAQQQGKWVCIGEFLEDASGFEYERPEMDIIWQLAKEKRITAIVVLRRNRFARGEAASMILEQHFKKHCVRLFSVEQGEFTPGHTNRIVSAVERAQSEEEAESLKKNLREKRYAYVNNGAVPSSGNATYGYTIVGRKAAAHYVINEDEAEVIRTIFDLYIARHSFAQIAEVIAALGVPQPADKPTKDGSRKRGNRFGKRGWHKAVVRRIVKNAELYRGEFVAYKYAVRDDAPEERKISIPAIIDESTYTKAKYIGEQSRITIFRARPSRQFLLTGRFSCACGYGYGGTTTIKRKSPDDVRYFHYYRCNSFAHEDKMHLCQMKHLHAEKIEAVLWDFIKSILTDPRTAISRYKQQQTELRKRLDNAIAHVESIDEVIAELNAEREQVLTLFRKRLIAEDRLEADIAVIDRQTDKLRIEREKWAAIIESNSITDAQIHQLEAISAAIRDELEDIDFERKVYILDRLRTKVTSAKEDGQVVLYVSLLGALPERLEVLQSDSDACGRVTFINYMVFRVAVPC